MWQAVSKIVINDPAPLYPHPGSILSPGVGAELIDRILKNRVCSLEVMTSGLERWLSG